MSGHNMRIKFVIASKDLDHPAHPDSLDPVVQSIVSLTSS